MQPAPSPPLDASSKSSSEHLSPPHSAPFNVRAIGTPGSLGFRVLFEDSTSNLPLSPWHDISLFGPNFTVSCVCMTPSGTWVRYKVAPDEDANPIRTRRRESFAVEEQLRGGDTKIWPAEGAAGMNSALPAHYHDNAAVNICFLPQTMELSRQSPGNEAEDDLPEGQPMELVDIGADKIRVPGEVYLVRPLGAVAVRSGHGSVVWKIIAIAVEDSIGPMLRSCTDVMVHLPGMVGIICDWFQQNSTGGPSRPDKDTPPPRLQPVEVVIAQEKIAQAHNAWAQYCKRAPKLEPSPRPLLDDYTSASSDDDGNKPLSDYLATTESSSWRSSIPLSCPLPESSIPFDPSWLLGASDRDRHVPASGAGWPIPPSGSRRSRRSSLTSLQGLEGLATSRDDPQSLVARELKRSKSTRTRRNSIHAPITDRTLSQEGGLADGDATLRELRRAASGSVGRKGFAGYGKGISSRLPDFLGFGDSNSGLGKAGLGVRTQSAVKASFSNPELDSTMFGESWLHPHDPPFAIDSCPEEDAKYLKVGNANSGTTWTGAHFRRTQSAIGIAPAQAAHRGDSSTLDGDEWGEDVVAGVSVKGKAPKGKLSQRLSSVWRSSSWKSASKSSEL